MVDGAQSAAAFSLFSIAFTGAGQLPMRDLLTDEVIGMAPEWVSGHRSAPVAFAHGTTPTLRVVFQASNVDVFPSGETYDIQARGAVLSVVPQAVALTIQPLDGFSAEIAFAVAAPIDRSIGIVSETLTWTATTPSGATVDLGQSTHTLLVTWRAAQLGADVLPPLVPYRSIAELAVSSCAGCTTLDAIARGLLAAVSSSGLGHTISGGNVRMLLLTRSADSSGFAALFSMLLAVHGITSQTRAFEIDWEALPPSALPWVNTATPRASPGVKGTQVHSVTLIEADGALLLADADAGVGPVPFPLPLPPDAPWAMTGAAFETLRASYLVDAAAKMNGRLVALLPPTPITVFTVHFAFEGGAALALVDPTTNRPVGATPEWIEGITDIGVDQPSGPHRPRPAAFVRGTRIPIEVTFRRVLDPQHGGAPALPDLIIGATGAPVGVVEQTATLVFNDDGRSTQVRFMLDGPVSTAVGLVEVTLHWYVQTSAGRQPIGTSVHPIYSTWKPMVAAPTEGLADWTYSWLVQWTSRFAAGATSDKDVCDRVMRHLPETGLKYGVAGWTPRQMLLGNGGMCGGWYQLFQAMLHAQGVRVEKRAFLVDWRTLAPDAVEWNAIVVSRGGLNQSAPPVTPTSFHDAAVFPVAAAADLTTTTVPRYRFWGSPGGWADGHCINFFEDDSGLYLYDASFGLGPIALTMPLPAVDTVLGGVDLEDFVAKYLCDAVSHLLGSFTVDGTPVVSTAPVGVADGVNGVSVVTSALPTMQGTVPVITFRWI